MTTPIAPRPSPSTTAPRPIWPTVVSVVALVVGLVGTVGLLFLALVLALCGIGGDTASCSDEHDAAGLAVIAAGALFLGVPAIVAAVRRDARWLLVPLVEGAGVGLVILANARF